MDFIKRYDEWVAHAELDKTLRAELLGIKGKADEIGARFSRDLEFGTGGLRGEIGAGTNRMNIYTVRRATQGLAAYIKKTHGGAGGVAIAYDSRNKSLDFALEAALVFAGNEIKALLFDALRPTPELSFAVRHLNCAAGIVITASHNPAKYNGYKVYGADGGQIGPVPAAEILREIEKTHIFTDIRRMKKERALSEGLLVYIGEEVDKEYYKNVKAQRINPRVAQKTAGVSLVYTPLHGAGNIPVRRVLAETGFGRVFVVGEQEKPDGDFPTVAFPNPEDEKAFALATALAKEKGADLIIGTDPDCDRVGAMVRAPGGEYVPISGNEMGVLLTEYILSQKSERGEMPPNPAIVSTIVSTAMTKAVCARYGAGIEEVLTGFKFIAEKIKEFEEKGDKTFVFGFEESYGYLAGTYCRDKDAVVASMLIAEMAAWYSLRGMTLFDAMRELYGRYGYYAQGVRNIYFEGLDGAARIKGIMERLRAAVPKKIAGIKVLTYSDYEKGIKCHENGATEETGLPRSNVLKLELRDKSWIAFRPSGTEPKFKVYYEVNRREEGEAQRVRAEISDEVDFILNA